MSPQFGSQLMAEEFMLPVFALPNSAPILTSALGVLVLRGGSHGGWGFSQIKITALVNRLRRTAELTLF